MVKTRKRGIPNKNHPWNQSIKKAYTIKTKKNMEKAYINMIQMENY